MRTSSACTRAPARIALHVCDLSVHISSDKHVGSTDVGHTAAAAAAHTHTGSEVSN